MLVSFSVAEVKASVGSPEFLCPDTDHAPQGYENGNHIRDDKLFRRSGSAKETTDHVPIPFF